jgi:acetylornithine deacetylase/succinyl-diaminopimelate desuccinylase-like protein
VPAYCRWRPHQRGAAGTDIPYLEGPQVPYLLGPGSITVAHRPDEAMRKQELGDAVLLLEDAILAILAQPRGTVRVPGRST